MALYRILLGIRINKYLKEMEKIKEKAASLLQKCEVVVLSSMNAEGYPRPVPIVRIASEGLSTIWMSTGASSLKTTEFRANAKAGLCYYSDGDSVVLTGEVEVIDDAESKEKYWQNWFIKFFPQGVKDPEYILLKFRSNQATIYIEDLFCNITAICSNAQSTKASTCGIKLRPVSVRLYSTRGGTSA